MTNTDPHHKYWCSNTDGTACIKDDKYLEPFADALRYRHSKYNDLLASITSAEGSLDAFSKAYETMGLHRVKGGVRYREWAPAAKQLYLFGEFNDWNRSQCPLTRDEYGIWECFVKETTPGVSPIKHGSKVKTLVEQHDGPPLDRNPAWAVYLTQDMSTLLYNAVFWDPPKKYEWTHPGHVKRPDGLRIYECHVGMGTNELKVGSYREFADNVLPHIKKTGYTALQIMAIMEHAYYASFGYHVTNFFAVSSRSGEPDDLKYLIDKAHQLGLYVLMDIVHSHASSNSMDGINQFDGTDHMYFHEGERGRHSLWDSRLFNYGHWEVLRFLLSNLRWYMEEYHFDGFRFDGVTSMLYMHSGIGVAFSGDYQEYFGFHVDIDACVYMMLANTLLHQLYPDVAVTIAEDVSGMPTLCVPVEDGGLGFDYRLAMAIPDMWIEMLEKVPDHEWNIGHLVHTMTNRRWNEKTIGYAESHDQALVGDKTLAFWLMDAAMYSDMDKSGFPTPAVERGIALHKMIRMLTMSLAGEGYLTFMGNEFGHPEWIDFPREGNNNSYQHARRRWDLCKNGLLRYKDLHEFECAMHALDGESPFLRYMTHQYVVLKHESDKVIVVEKGDRLLFVYNFHHSNSYTGYRVGTYWGGRYRLVLDSDCSEYGGHGRLETNHVYDSRDGPWMERPHWLELYLPARTCQVYRCFETWAEKGEREQAERDGRAAPAPAQTAAAAVADGGDEAKDTPFEAAVKKAATKVASEQDAKEVEVKGVQAVAEANGANVPADGVKEVESVTAKLESGVKLNGQA